METTTASKLNYIVIIPNAYGKGETVEIAYKNARNAIGQRGKPKWRVVYSYPSDKSETVHVDGMGTLYGEGMAKTEDTRKS